MGFRTFPGKFLVCEQFAGNPCRVVETVRFYTDRQTHTHKHTGMKLFVRYIMYPVYSQVSIGRHGPFMQSPSHLAIYAVTQSLYAVTQPRCSHSVSHPALYAVAQPIMQSPSPICSTSIPLLHELRQRSTTKTERREKH